jgi:hypothetical protein
VTPAGAVRFVWATPSDLTDLLSAEVAIIPGGIDSGSFLNLFVCPADTNGAVAGACVGPLPTIFSGTPNKLTEVDVSLSLMPHVGDPGFTYVAILAYTTPTTSTDYIVGLRMTYHAPNPTLAANTFFGTQTAPLFSGNFAGNGAGLTNLPVPAGAATLGANTFIGVQTAPGFSGSGAGLTDVARLTANTFTGTQRITSGNLSLDASTALTTGNLMKDGQFFLHTLGSPGNTYLGLSSGVFSSGGGNTGNDALGGNTTGASNIAVGTDAGFTQTTGSNNIYLGNQIRGVAGESSTMYLGAGMDPFFGCGQNASIGNRLFQELCLALCRRCVALQEDVRVCVDQPRQDRGIRQVDELNAGRGDTAGRDARDLAPLDGDESSDELRTHGQSLLLCSAKTSRAEFRRRRDAITTSASRRPK